MDEYVVRLGRAPGATPQNTGTIPVPASGAPRRARMRRRYRVLLVAGLVYLAAHLAAPGLVASAFDAAVERVTDPIESLDGEAQLRDATTAMGTAWATHQRYDLTPAQLEALDGDVAWGDIVTVKSCFGGTAAVLVARTVRGSVSRLLVRGDDVGDARGDLGCPRDLTKPFGH